MSDQPWFLHFLGKLSPAFHLVNGSICCTIKDVYYYFLSGNKGTILLEVLLHSNGRQQFAAYFSGVHAVHLQLRPLPLPLCQAAEQYMRRRLVPR